MEWAQEPLPQTEARHEVIVEVADKRLSVTVPKRLLVGEIGSAQGHAPKRKASAHSSGHTGAKGNVLLAPMQATVVKLAVEVGAQVAEGDLVAVLEAMKMENQILAEKSGKVTEIKVKAGDTVGSGDVVVVIA